jgi:hypothetical protein
MLDTRTNAERRRDTREASLTTAQRIARHEVMIARAEAKGFNRPELYAELTALRRKRK